MIRVREREGGREGGREDGKSGKLIVFVLRFRFGLTVYDGTGFLKDHPGGAESITLMAGEDATEDL